MDFLSQIGGQNLLTIAAIVVGAVVVFWIVHKIVKFLLALAIVALLAAAALVFCVKAGYISQKTAEKINPLKSERITRAVKDAGAWAGDKAKDAAKKAIDAALDDAVKGADSSNHTH